MNDLVERLREEGRDPAQAWLNKAADSIAQLEAETNRLRGFEAANRMNAAQVTALRAHIAQLEAALADSEKRFATLKVAWEAERRKPIQIYGSAALGEQRT